METKTTTLLVLGSGAHNNEEGTKRTTPAIDALRYLSEQGIRGKLFLNDTMLELFPNDYTSEAFSKAHHIIAGYILEIKENKKT